jgi:demethylsterigmatocystin 6-O-methyltransferase
MDCIIEQIKSLANDADDMARKTIMDQLRDVSISLETPQDAMQRICYTVTPTFI